MAATTGPTAMPPIPCAEPRTPNQNGETLKTSSAKTTMCCDNGMAKAEMKLTAKIAVRIPGASKT